MSDALDKIIRIDENKKQELDKAQSTDEPNKWKFIAEQAMALFRETYVRNPDDVTYQFSRKITKDIVDAKYKNSSNLVTEGVAIGLYKSFENLLKKILAK